MRKHILFWLGLTFFLMPALGYGQAPHEIAGFVLGKNISQYRDRIKPETDLPVRHTESVHEVEIKDMDGFKSGVISYGTCEEPGKIIRIRLKYADNSKTFYETLLKHFKDRFGQPSEWRGDPFHIVINWKWSFTDTENNRISLQLQHNTKDSEENIGNTVKLAMTNAVEAEQRCFDKKEAEAKNQGEKAKGRGRQEPITLEHLIPR